MKCYYLGDKKITEAEAKEIEAKNREILRDGTVEELLQIRHVICREERKMEHTFKIEKELKITTENIVDCVLSCEAGGFDYWGELCSDEKDYEAARQRLAEREKADMKPCYEDVLAEILESGGKLTVYDREDDKDHELTLEKLLNGWKKYAEDHNADDFDEYDGISADCIMQYAIFGDVIYG